MPSQDFLHFQLGKTYFEGSPDAATDGEAILGEEIEVRHSSGRMTTYRIVRNSAGIAVLPKRLAVLNATGTAITGYARLPSDRGVPIDSALPTAGCATNDICLVAVKGPAIALTDLADYAADLAAGDWLTSQTAATSQATTAGRIKLRTVSSSVTANMTETDGVFARAISTALTNDTNTDVLIDVGAIW
jgi:hypothetical protein